jgi:hypothetical protein
VSVERGSSAPFQHDTKTVLPWTSHPLEMLPREDREPYKGRIGNHIRKVKWMSVNK